MKDKKQRGVGGRDKFLYVLLQGARLSAAQSLLCKRLRRAQEELFKHCRQVGLCDEEGDVVFDFDDNTDVDVDVDERV